MNAADEAMALVDRLTGETPEPVRVFPWLRR
jgi:hypothetical protein